MLPLLPISSLGVCMVETKSHNARGLQFPFIAATEYLRSTPGAQDCDHTFTDFAYILVDAPSNAHLTRATNIRTACALAAGVSAMPGFTALYRMRRRWSPLPPPLIFACCFEGCSRPPVTAAPYPSVPKLFIFRNLRTCRKGPPRTEQRAEVSRAEIYAGEGFAWVCSTHLVLRCHHAGQVGKYREMIR